ncbi:MAG: 30S ribosomal protein S20 [Dehalococcoidales bacterium]|nr:30S ribosomal protein S20 [Dehalococcoidales bacterium]
MAVTKSAKKGVRQTERRRLQNKAVRSLSKTNITKAEKLTFAGELEAARGAIATAISSLDKAAEKGVIHPNNAARRKSRLMKKLNKALAATPTAAPTKKARAKPSKKA